MKIDSPPAAHNSAKEANFIEKVDFGAAVHGGGVSGHERLCGIGSLLYLFVAYFNRHVEATEVCYDAHTEYLYATMSGNNHLRHSAHSYSIATQKPVHAIFGGSLEGWSLYTHINAMLKLYAFFLGYLVGKCYQ